jgi:hypothetical protein
MQVARRKVGGNIDSFRATLATYRFACLRGRRWYHEKQLPSPLHCRVRRSWIHRRYLPISFFSVGGKEMDSRTPASMLPFGRGRAWRASSISVHPFQSALLIQSVEKAQTRRINTTDQKIPQILSISPNNIINIFGWNNPTLTLDR